jgi:hypothetical protein
VSTAVATTQGDPRPGPKALLLPSEAAPGTVVVAPVLAHGRAGRGRMTGDGGSDDGERGSDA